MKNLKAFITECLFFGKPTEGELPNWILAVMAWTDIFIICYGLFH